MRVGALVAPQSRAATGGAAAPRSSAALMESRCLQQARAVFFLGGGSFAKMFA